MTNSLTFDYEHAFIGYEASDSVDAASQAKFCKEVDITSHLEKITKAKGLECLGIYEDTFKVENSFKSGLRASYVVGYKWLVENETAICVKPKLDESEFNARADITKMFAECFHSPLVAKGMNEVYGIEWEQPRIQIEEKDDVLTPLIIMHFLQVVKSLSKKGLKKGYMSVIENLTAKVKGKILINQTIKHNHFKNRLDKTVCSHQIFTTNCLENQIIKTALAHVSRYVYQNMRENTTFTQMLRFDQMMFEMVDTKEVNLADFKKIKHSPFFKEYKEALRLAEMIFRRLGFSLQQADHEAQKYAQIPPYHIDMSKLFEKYVELRLREGGVADIEAQFSSSKPFLQKPDFLYKIADADTKMIIDAKYKYWYKFEDKPASEKTDSFRDDMRQLSLYAITDEIRGWLGMNGSTEHVKKVIVYPVAKEDENNKLKLDSPEDRNKIKGFIEMYKIGLKIPTIPVQST